MQLYLEWTIHLNDLLTRGNDFAFLINIYIDLGDLWFFEDFKTGCTCVNNDLMYGIGKPNIYLNPTLVSY